MDERLCAILRRPDGLLAVIVRPREPRPELPPRPTCDPADWSAPYELDGRPLEQAPRALCPQRDALLGAWDRLQRVRRWNGAALADLLAIVIDTLPDLRARCDAPPLEPIDLQRRPAPRPTAAHPRAYRGTKTKPPKPSSPDEPLDARPHLCVKRNLDALLRHLAPLVPDALERLEKAGRPRPALLRLGDAVLGGTDPYLAYHHGQKGELGLWSWPPAFVSGILPALRGEGMPRVLEALALLRALDLERDQALLLALGHLLSHENAPCALPWIGELLSGRRPQHRVLVTALLAASGAWRAQPQRLGSHELDRLFATPDATRLAHRLHYLFRMVASGIDPHEILPAFELAEHLQRAYSFDEAGGSADFPAETVQQLVARLDEESPEGREHGWTALRLWTQTRTLPGLGGVLRAQPWSSLCPESAAALLELLSGVQHEWIEGARLERKWSALRGWVARLGQPLLATPAAYQPKLLGLLEQGVLFWDEPAELTRLPELLHLALRVARPPLRTSDLAADVLRRLVEGDEALRQGLPELPDESLAAVEAACKLWNDRFLLFRGLDELGKHAGAWVLDGLRRRPRKLLSAARMLGTLSAPRRLQVIEQFRRHPLAALGLERHEPQPVLELLRQHLGELRTNPIPRKLREHLEGRRTLSAGQLARARRHTLEMLDLVRLEVLEALVLEALRGELPADPHDEGARHALELHACIAENRRGLRRLLQAHWSGQRQYLLEHPASREWLRRHPELDVRLWTEGLEHTALLPGLGSVTIALERDPIEALRLGTLTGTCLGIGGLCDYSAAAVVLDVNKQVLYARSERGTVLARQIVAISEEGHLVCFHVYPAGTSPELHAAFRELDRRLAAALGLPLLGSSASDYEIVNILSETWWDDGALGWTSPMSGPLARRAGTELA
jgi:hypothetical protein